MNPAPFGPRFSQLIELTVQPLQAGALASAMLAQAQRFSCECPGFIKCTVHLGEQGSQVLMHLLWDSKANAEQAITQLQNVEPDFFDLAQRHNVGALLFSTYDVVGEVCR